MIRARTKKSGERCLQIDLTFRRVDGTRERFRQYAQVQTRAGAAAEERRVIAHFVDHGTLSTFNAPRREPGASKTWKDAVEHFEAVKLPTLKASTKAGYEELLACTAFDGWPSMTVDRIDYAFVEAWSARLAPAYGRSRLRNLHVLVRSVLRSLLGDVGMPRLPKLPKVGRTVVRAMSHDDVWAVLGEADDLDDSKRHGEYRGRQRRAARLAFALGALAGLRAGEIRGLRWSDVDLKRGTLVVRIARVVGVEDAPKSGHQREVPLTPHLLELLASEHERREPKADHYVAPMQDGRPWSDSGLIQALRSACDRLGIPRDRVHGLRHYFVTALFEAGVDAITVMELAGHADLSTTQRYADASKQRKRDAVRALGGSRLVPRQASVGVGESPEPSR